MKTSLSLLLITTLLLVGCGSSIEADRESIDLNSMGQDPLIQNTIRVSFEITVPAYQSDELSVELNWGDENLTALWVGDEFWSASGEFPTETQHLLTATFYDKNGDIELSMFSQEFKTGTTDAEYFQISADQFIANQFDTDKDGVNNLDESIAGTDPLVDENSVLEIFEASSLNSFFSVSKNFESLLTDERPYSNSYNESLETSITSSPKSFYRTTRSGDINIDADGNGELSHYYQYINHVRHNVTSLSGIRTNSGSSILWEGQWQFYDGDYTRTINFNNEVTVVDASTRDYVDVVIENFSGTYTDTWVSNINLTGKIIDGSSHCKPVAGTFTSIHRTNRTGYASEFVDSRSVSISKENSDRYWRVVAVDHLNDNEITEYFVRELKILRNNGPDDAYFICDFVDL